MESTAWVSSGEPGKSYYGLHHMAGNVAEWVKGEGKDDYLRRGGSYKNPPSNCESVFESRVKGNRGNEETGFRIVRNPV